jgi:Ca2+-binding RTX toxin-like protein
MRTTLVLAGLALVAAGLPLGVPAQAALAETCLGKVVTISDSDGGSVEGTDGDDVILASGGDDQNSISAKGGNDTICLGEGVVFAGTGKDSVYVGGEVMTEYLDIRDAENLGITIGAGGAFLQLVNIRRGDGSVDVGAGAALTLIGKNKVDVDLEDDTMKLDGGSYSLVGTPGIFSIARSVVLVGDAADNNLRINQYSCKATIKGGKGDDDLEIAGSDGDLLFPKNCGTRKPKVYGQKGDDTLTGRRYDDLLVGGPGKDEAFGSFGTDTCVAETEKNCER